MISVNNIYDNKFMKNANSERDALEHKILEIAKEHAKKYGGVFYGITYDSKSDKIVSSFGYDVNYL